MPVEEVVATALLFLGVVLGPAIFLLAIISWVAKKLILMVVAYRQRQYLRSLPCRNCRYFTNDEFLPCAVNPLQALTDEAHSCYDFSLTEIYKSVNARGFFEDIIKADV